MVSNGCPVEVDGIVEVIHDLALANMDRRLYSSLELVPSVEIEDVSLILSLNRLDHLGHVLQTSIGELLIGIVPKEISRERSPMDIIGSDYCHFVESVLQRDYQQNEN